MKEQQDDNRGNSNTQKVAFITGGNRGLGFQTAKELGEKGVKVVIGARDILKGKEAVKKLARQGIEAEAIQFDIGREGDYKVAFDYFNSHFGRLDILVNNAGIMIEEQGVQNPISSGSLSVNTIRETFDSNFFAQIALTQALIPLIKKSESGRIVNLSSILGSLTLHTDVSSPIYNMKQLAYDASKAALNMFTVHLAHELRDTKIKVNSAHPGWVQTDMGGPNAPMPIEDGSKTSAALALLPDDGPTGGFFHMGERLPW